MTEDEMKVKGLVIWLGGQEKDKRLKVYQGLGSGSLHLTDQKQGYKDFSSTLVWRQSPSPAQGHLRGNGKKCCPASPLRLLLWNFHAGHPRCSKSSFPRDPEPHQQPHQETGQPEGLKERGGERKWVGPARLIPDNHRFYVGPPMA